MKKKLEKISIKIGRVLYVNYPDDPAVFGFDETGKPIDDELPAYVLALVDAVRNEA